MKSISLFGATTPSGQAFIKHLSSSTTFDSIYLCSRSSSDYYIDLGDFSSFDSFQGFASDSICVSFAPIWLFAPFLEYLFKNHPSRLSSLNGIVACSSSSVITKRFAFNRYDRNLVAKLHSSENLLLDLCKRLRIPCKILQPTLIYGSVGNYSDRNLSRILHLLQFLPFLPLPARTGLRQPIHSLQLASVSASIAEKMYFNPETLHENGCIALGGDVVLSYKSMIDTLLLAQPVNHLAKYTFIFVIPNRLFFLIISPLLIISPKVYESFLRMCSDLSGFLPSCKILDSEPQPFPLSDN